jgi:hypothetical protein
VRGSANHMCPLQRVPCKRGSRPQLFSTRLARVGGCARNALGVHLYCSVCGQPWARRLPYFRWGLVAVCEQTSLWNPARGCLARLPPVRWQLRSWNTCYARRACDGELMGIWCVQSATPSQRARSSTSFVAELLAPLCHTGGFCIVRVLLLHVQACAEHFQKSGDTADGVSHASHPP